MSEDDEEPVLRVLAPDGDFAAHGKARLLAAYLNSPEMRAKIRAETVAGVVNETLYGPDPSGWPQ